MAQGLGPLILRRRRELGLSQQELARRIGVPTASMSSLEQTVSRWQSRLVVALARELCLPQIELALAAGIVTDLPPLDGGEPGDDLDAVLAGLGAGVPEPSGAPTLDRLAHDIAALPSAHQRFLAALIRQLQARMNPAQPERTAAD